jgi:hypothetical protein
MTEGQQGQQPYRAGDVVNGYRLSEAGAWEPVATAPLGTPTQVIVPAQPQRKRGMPGWAIALIVVVVLVVGGSVVGGALLIGAVGSRVSGGLQKIEANATLGSSNAHQLRQLGLHTAWKKFPASTHRLVCETYRQDPQTAVTNMLNGVMKTGPALGSRAEWEADLRQFLKDVCR